MSRIAVIAACGKSARTGLGEYTTKAAFRLENRSLLGHTIDFLRRSEIERIFVVCRPEHARVLGMSLLSEERQQVAFVLSEPGAGWAGTVEKAISFVDPDDEVVLVSCDNYHTAPSVQSLGVKFDVLFTYTKWENQAQGPTNGPVFGRKEGDEEWKVQTGIDFVGEFFTGYVVVRGKVLLEGLRELVPSERGEKEIVSLLEILSRLPRCRILPYAGRYEDVSDLVSYARLAARIQGVEDSRAVDVGAGVLVHDAQDHILLLERQDGRGWVPPGGLVDNDETYIEAAIRETEEEAGHHFEPRALRLLGVYPAEGKNDHLAVSVLFVGEGIQSSFCAASHETKNLNWFSKKELAKITIPFGLRQAIDDYFEGKELDTRNGKRDVRLSTEVVDTKDKFVKQNGLILFSSDKPGSHATLFGPGGYKLDFRSDASSFNDRTKSYVWAFANSKELKEGTQFVFATADREALGVVRRGKVKLQALSSTMKIERDARGEPVRVKEEATKEQLQALDDLIKETEKLGLYEGEFGDGDRTERMVVSEPEPRVSILTCTYNRPEMLQEAILSIRTQTSTDWEHLIYDNGSTDPKTREVLEKAKQEDPRVRVFYAKENIDQPAVRWNELIDRAKGRYIGFLDDDNTKYMNFIEVMAGALDERKEVDMVTCGFVMYEMSGRAVLCQTNLETATRIHDRNTVDTGAFLIRREALEKIGYFPLAIRTNEDWAMMRRAVACLNMEHRAEILATWREHGGQRMRRTEALGNKQDKTWIESETWYGEIGVRVHVPKEDSLISQYSTKEIHEVQDAILKISWLKEGSDFDLVLGPSRMQAMELDQIASNAKRLLLVYFDDPLEFNLNMAQTRVAANCCKQTWGATNVLELMLVYQDVLNERVIGYGMAKEQTKADFPAWSLNTKTRMSRVLNAVRSSRYGAVIP